MTSKDRRFINDPSELLQGWNHAQLYLQPGLALDERFSVLHKRNLADDSRVTVISGGGSGHEPAHSGYLGDGMLDATVSGAIFASPNVAQIYRALELASSPKGTIVIVKNYTGDKLNFALATERFKCSTRQDVRMIIVGDDVSIGRSRGKFVGRRGLAGTILVHKIVGAAAHRGLNMDQIIPLSDLMSQGLGTIGASLGPCSVPGQVGIDHSEMRGISLGMGIHNEPAIRNMPSETSTQELVEEMLDVLLNPTKAEHAFILPAVGKGGKLVLLMNNLGGLSNIELGSLTSTVVSQLQKKYGVSPCRVYAGTFLSSLDGRGFSITLLSLDESPTTSLILELLDQSTTATGWTPTVSETQWALESIDHRSDKCTKNQPESPGCPMIEWDISRFSQAIHAVFDEVSAREPTITQYDTILGDGDCGTTLLAGARALVQGIRSGRLSTSNMSQGMSSLAEIVTEAMGGTSGAIYGIYLSAFAASLTKSYDATTGLNAKYFASAMKDALETLEKFTGARVGDRTLMDTLIPFVNAFQEASKTEETVEALKKAIHCAQEGLESTKYLESKFGRSTYVGNTIQGDGESSDPIPDPGACGIVAVVTGILKAFL